MDKLKEISVEVEKFKELKRKISCDEALQRDIKEYKELDGRFNTKVAGGETLSGDEERLRSTMYQQLALGGDGAAFLEAESKLAVLLNGIFTEIVDEIGIDIDFYL